MFVKILKEFSSTFLCDEEDDENTTKTCEPDEERKRGLKSESLH